MKRVIAFLGISPQQARYDFEGGIYEGRSFPEALRQFLAFDRLHVFVTPQARDKTLPALLALNDPRIEAVDIPDGRDSAEMWEIFDKLVGVVDDGDTLIFDITHAFRSIPFFVMLALAYLKSAYDNVRIERVFYGGFMFGDPAPVIDLTEFIGLLDWMSATDQFVGFGNSQALVRLVKEAALHGAGEAEDRVKLMNFASSLDDVSRCLQLVMPDKAMSAGFKLHYSLEQARDPLQHRLRPFLPLADRVDTAFAAMALAEPRDRDTIWQSLDRERGIVYWYLDRQLLLQAITLAFEWLLSYGLAYLGYPTLYDGESRSAVRFHYTTYNRRHDKSDDRPSPAQIAAAEQALRGIPDFERVLKLYERTSKLRNDLLHASKTVNPNYTPANRERDIRDVCRQLDGFLLRQA